MVPWLPSNIKETINLSHEVVTKKESAKLSKLTDGLDVIEKRLIDKVNPISTRELKACSKLINANLDLVNLTNKVDDKEIDVIMKRISTLFSKIIHTSESQASAIAAPKESLKFEPVLNLVFLCDIDAHDD